MPRTTYGTELIRATDLIEGDVAKIGGQLLTRLGKDRPLTRATKEPALWRYVHAVASTPTELEPSDRPHPGLIGAKWVEVEVDAGEPLEGYSRVLTLRLRPYDLVRVQVARPAR